MGLVNWEKDNGYEKKLYHSRYYEEHKDHLKEITAKRRKEHLEEEREYQNKYNATYDADIRLSIAQKIIDTLNNIKKNQEVKNAI